MADALRVVSAERGGWGYPAHSRCLLKAREGRPSKRMNDVEMICVESVLLGSRPFLQTERSPWATESSSPLLGFLDYSPKPFSLGCRSWSPSQLRCWPPSLLTEHTPVAGCCGPLSLEGDWGSGRPSGLAERRLDSGICLSPRVCLHVVPSELKTPAPILQCWFLEVLEAGPCSRPCLV